MLKPFGGSQLMNAIENVINGWRKVGVRLNPGATPENIRRLETALGVSLPEDVVAYFLTMNGTDEEHTAAGLTPP
jgi:cell wall assembly regulator SMI1